MEGKAVVLAWFRNVAVAAQPELFVFKDYFLQVFKCDDDGIHFAELAKFEELDGRNLDSISRKLIEDYILRVRIRFFIFTYVLGTVGLAFH